MMTREEQQRLGSMIEKYGPDAFLQAFMTLNPDNSAAIKSVMDQHGSVGAARMLFNYIPAGGMEVRTPGPAQMAQQTGMPNLGVGGLGQPRVEAPAQGMGIVPSQRQAVGVGTTVGTPGVRTGPTAEIAAQTGVPRRMPRAERPVAAMEGTAPQGIQVGQQEAPGMTVQPAPSERAQAISGLAAQAGKPILVGDALMGGMAVDPTADPYTFFDTMKETSKEFGIPLEVVMAMMKQESVFDPEAKSKVGARGLLQLMQATAIDRGLVVDTDTDERLEPMKNIRAGLAHMKWIKENYKPANVKSWLAAYNAGHTRLKKDQWKKMKEPREYAESVSKYAKEYKEDPTKLAADFLRLYKNIQKRGEK